jgi:hypothetical protein
MFYLIFGIEGKVYTPRSLVVEKIVYIPTCLGLR